EERRGQSGDEHRACQGGPDGRAEVRERVLETTHLAALLVWYRRDRDASQLRCERAHTETGEQHGPRHDLGSGALVEGDDHHDDAGEQRQEAEPDDATW